MAGALAKGIHQAHPAEDIEVEVWEENIPVVHLFLKLRTQRRHAGMGAMVGFDYTPLFHLLDRQYPDRDDWEAAFDAFRIMEEAAIEAANTI